MLIIMQCFALRASFSKIHRKTEELTKMQEISHVYEVLSSQLLNRVGCNELKRQDESKRENRRLHKR